MGGKCAEMGCFEGKASWLRHDCTPEEGLSDPVLPQKRPFEGIFAPPGRSHRRLLARCFVHLRRVSCTTLGVTRTDKVVTQWHMAQTSLIHSSPLSTASRTTPARSPHVNERIAFAVSPATDIPLSLPCSLAPSPTLSLLEISGRTAALARSRFWVPHSPRTSVGEFVFGPGALFRGAGPARVRWWGLGAMGNRTSIHEVSENVNHGSGKCSACFMKATSKLHLPDSPRVLSICELNACTMWHWRSETTNSRSLWLETIDLFLPERENRFQTLSGLVLIKCLFAK